jgi:hypothetical protein
MHSHLLLLLLTACCLHGTAAPRWTLQTPGRSGRAPEPPHLRSLVQAHRLSMPVAGYLHHQ